MNVNAQYEKLLDFSGINGRRPSGSLISDGTYLYGMTRAGGANNYGNIFKIKPDGTGFTNVHNFDSIHGKNPTGSLLSDGVYLYGMTYSGGAYERGTIFKIKLDGTSFIILLDFNSINGDAPTGNLINDGTYLYGMTNGGGAYAKGTIFKIKTDGSDYVKLHDFNVMSEGRNPVGSLVYDGAYLYGMTVFGGISNSSNMGVIFKIKPDGTNFTVLHSFDHTSGGYTPCGSLIRNGTYLYGMAGGEGYSNGAKVLFKIKTDGTDYTVLHSFSGTEVSLQGSLISDCMYLYGMTIGVAGGDGNLDNNGTIFKIKPDGTDFTNLFYFGTNGSQPYNSPHGSQPYGDLVSDGTYLYGMTFLGGTNNMGVIFKYYYENPCINTTSVAEHTNNIQFAIYPNPTNEILNVEFENVNQNIEIKVFDVLGKEELSVKDNTQQINVNSLPNGVYFIKVGNTVQKFIKY